MHEHCPKTEIDDWLCRGLDELVIYYEHAFLVEGFAVTPQKRDYLARGVTMTVEEGLGGMPQVLDVERVVQELYRKLDRLKKGSVETVYWQQSAIAEIWLLVTLKVPTNEVVLPEEHRAWLLRTNMNARPTLVMRKPEPKVFDPGEPLPVIRTGLCSLTN